MNTSAQIPAHIHYVWGKDEPLKPLAGACFMSWHLTQPGWKITQWDESNFDFEKHLATNRFFREVYQRKMWAFVSDYMRLHILYEHGGVYCDTDIQLLKPLDRFLQDDFFVGVQANHEVLFNNNTIAVMEPAIFGCKPQHPLVKKMIEFYDENVWKMDFYILPSILAFYLKEHFNFIAPELTEITTLTSDDVGKVTLYPKGYLIPFDWREEFSLSKISPNTYAIHWYNGLSDGGWTKSATTKEWFLTKPHHSSKQSREDILINGNLSFFKQCSHFLKKAIKIRKQNKGKD